MRSAPADIRSPFQRDTPCPPDIFTLTMATEAITFPKAVDRLARAAGLLLADLTDRER